MKIIKKLKRSNGTDVKLQIISILFLMVMISLSIPILSSNKTNKTGNSLRFESQSSGYLFQSTKLLAKSVESDMSRFEKYMDSMQTEAVHDYLKNAKFMEKQERWVLLNLVKTILSETFVHSKEVLGANVITNSGEVITYSTTGYSFKDAAKLMLNSNVGRDFSSWEYVDTGVGFESKTKNIVFRKPIYIANDSEFLGTLCITLKDNYFSNILKELDLGENSEIFISNSNGEVVSGKNPIIKLGNEPKYKVIYDNIVKIAGFNKLSRIQVGGKDYQAISLELKNSNWQLIFTLPESSRFDLSSSNEPEIYTNIIFAFVILTLSMAVYFYIPKAKI